MNSLMYKQSYQAGNVKICIMLVTNFPQSVYRLSDGETFWGLGES
jgi:hypothetical protein